MPTFDPFDSQHTVELMKTLEAEGFPTDLFSTEPTRLHHLDYVNWAQHRAFCEGAIARGSRFLRRIPTRNADVARRLHHINKACTDKKPLSMGNWKELCMKALDEYPLQAPH